MLSIHADDYDDTQLAIAEEGLWPVDPPDGAGASRGPRGWRVSYDEVSAKFLDCAAFAKWPAAKGKGIMEMVRNLEDALSLSALTALCAS